jgi:hypothetical protein
MSKVRVHISVSADGYVAGPNQSEENPLGEGGERLHDWVVALRAGRAPHGLEGGEVNASTPVVEESLANVGAEIMGRGKFGGGPGPWGDDPWRGWWGEEPPFRTPVFVLSDPTKLVIVAGAVLSMGAARFAADADIVIDLPEMRVGQYYYILFYDDSSLAVIAARHTLGPDSAVVGGFHYAPGGNAEARVGGSSEPGINPLSIWDAGFRSVCPDPPIRAQTQGGRVRVASLKADGTATWIPLRVDGHPRLRLDLRWWCTWDSTGHYLAIEDSRILIGLADINEPLLRVEYERRVPSAHMHVHAESGPVAHLLTKLDPEATLPRLASLHLPVGGVRFRPCLEDVLEFAIQELGVESLAGWETAIADGQQRWRWVQLQAAVRDAIRADAGTVTQLHELIDGIARRLKV